MEIPQPEQIHSPQFLNKPTGTAYSDNQPGSRWLNGMEVAKYYSRFLTIQKCFCLCLLLRCILIVLYYEIDYSQNQFTDVLLYCLLACSGVCAFLGAGAFISFNDWKNVECMQSSCRGCWELAIQLLTLCLQPYPFLQDFYIGNKDYLRDEVMPYKLNYLLVLMSCLKIHLMASSLLNILKFKSPRVSRLCKIYGCENSNFHLVKYLFTEQPIKVTAALFALCIFVFSFAYRVGERNVYANQRFFEYYSNCLWLVVVTISTVGFGEFVPVTLIGRNVGFMCTFCGVMTVSVLVLVIMNTLQMGYAENKSLLIQKKLNIGAEIKVLAGQYIREALWRVWTNRKKKPADRKLQAESQKIKRRKFRQKLRELKCLRVGPSNFNSQMHTEFQKVSANLENLSSNCDEILSYLSNNYFLDLNEIKNESDFNFVALK